MTWGGSESLFAAMPATPCTIETFRALVAPLLARAQAPDRFVVAVSGGADSMALMRLAVAAFPGQVIAATVDHGLRPESALEAARVGVWAEQAGVHHRTLIWRQGAVASGLQAKARSARYELLSALCRTDGSPARALPLFTAHTLEDQAETFLMRLARGSGLVGLACMAPMSELPGAPPVALLRPLLGVSSEKLRATLRALGQEWIEDPSNQDRRFERVRVRAAMPAVSRVGLTAARLARSAAAFRAIRDDLTRRAVVALHEIARDSGVGWIVLDPDQLAALPEPLAVRLMEMVLMGYGGAAYPPPPDSLSRLRQALANAGFAGATLAGCRLEPIAGGVLVGREPGRLGNTALRVRAGEVIFWDRRFFVRIGTRLSGDLMVGPLGDNGACTGVPRRWACKALPAVWRDGHLLWGAGLGGEADEETGVRVFFAGLARVSGTLAATYSAWLAQDADS